MNFLIVIIVPVVLFMVASIGLVLSKNANKIGAIMLLCLGVMAIAGGAYLLPASMWLSIAYSLFAIGGLLVLGSILLLCKQAKIEN